MNDRGIVSDQVLMDFMKEMREEVKGIKSLFLEQAGHMATVKEKQKNLSLKIRLLWSFGLRKHRINCLKFSIPASYNSLIKRI